MAPRGKPPARASSDAMPVGRHFRIWASGRSPSVVTRAAFGFMQFRLFFATHILLTWLGVVKSTLCRMRYTHTMDENAPTRRAVLLAAAAAPLLETALDAQNSTSSLCFMSAIEMARLIRTKKLSAREALAAHLKQIERVNPKVNAIVTLVAEMAAGAAAKADEAQARKETLGPLHGLPVAHKDLLETRGIRTTFGSLLYKDYIPTEDDLVVERIRRAGAITIGKTNTPEFGAGS